MSALVGSPNPCLRANVEGGIYKWRRSSRRWRLTQDEDVLATWFSSALLAILYHGQAGCQSEDLTLSNINFGDWLWYYSILGVSDDFPRFGIYWQVAIQKCLDSWSHSWWARRKMSKSLGNGLIQWVLLILEQIAFCWFLFKRFCTGARRPLLLWENGCFMELH